MSPPEMGPPLEWCEESKYYPLQGAIFYFVLCVVAGTVIYRGLEWTSNVYLWIFNIFICVSAYFALTKVPVVAGAGWVQQHNKWVSTYDLVTVKSTTIGYARASKLIDVHGNEVVLNLRHAQNNPLLWDLVYNGIVHSVANGADISNAARRILKV